MEVEEDLVQEYKEKLGYFMRVAGDSYMTSEIVKMSADADVGLNWYSAKKGE